MVQENLENPCKTRTIRIDYSYIEGRFIKDFARIAALLHVLVRKEQK